MRRCAGAMRASMRRGGGVSVGGRVCGGTARVAARARSLTGRLFVLSVSICPGTKAYRTIVRVTVLLCVATPDEVVACYCQQ